MEIELAGVRLSALPERALYAADEATLFVADLHVGKTDAFRAGGVPLPDGAGANDLARLDSLLDRMPVRRLIVLGDLIHCSTGMTDGAVASFAAWRARRSDLSLVLVRGNHDRRVARLPDEWGVQCVEEPFAWNGIDLRHHPTGESAMPLGGNAVPQLAGHVHPTARLFGLGGQSVRLPCFWLRGQRLILPAFTEFSAGARIEPAEGDRVFVIADGETIEAPYDRGETLPDAAA
jgi:DNA ligase-associated metallophosphoesterase